MKIYLATDHAGFEHKEKIKAHLKELGYQVADEGAYEYNPEDDYPDFVKIVAKQVASDPADSKGIIFGGSGQGEAMQANRFKGVRAAVYYGGPTDIITLSREHNDANVLSIGARFVSIEEAIEAIHLWLGANFSTEEKYARRNSKMDYDKQERPEF